MPTRKLSQLLATYSEDVRRIALAADSLIRDCLPNVDQRVDRARPIVGYGYAPGYKGLVCTLLLSQREVKIGVVDGATLDAPEGVMSNNSIGLHRLGLQPRRLARSSKF